MYRLLFFLLLGITVSSTYFWGFSHGRDSINQASGEKLAVLQQMLVDQSDGEVRSALIDQIQQTNKALGYTAMSIDVAAIVAVFALPQNPFVLFPDDKCVQLGDLLMVGSTHGYVSAITSRRLTLTTISGLISYKFPELSLFGRPSIGRASIVIYRKEGNLESVLMAVCKVNGLVYQGKIDCPANIVGFFIHDNYEGFLDEISPYIFVRHEKERLLVLPSKNLRGYIGFTRFFKKPFFGPLKKVLKEFGAYLSYDVRFQLSGELSKNPSLGLAINQFSDVCSDLDLIFQIERRILTISNLE